MMESQIDFAIITAIEVERRAICKAFQMGKQHEKVRSHTYWQKRLKLEDGKFYEIVVAQASDMGNFDLLALVKDTVNDWHPAAMLLVGIAAGVAPEQQQLGDLVIGSDVYYYGLGKVTPTGTLPQPKMYPANPKLLERVKNIGIADWKTPILSTRPDGTEARPKIHYGVIASGEKVIADEAIRDEIVSGHRKIMAVEMEGYGFSAAAWQSQVDCLIIKAICDFADSSKNDGWHEYAAAAAASFTKHFLLNCLLVPINPPIPSSPIPDPSSHYNDIVTALTRGRLIPFLGEEINLCDRPQNEQNYGTYPPTDSELAEHLIKKLDCYPFSEVSYKNQYPKLPEKFAREEKLGPNQFIECPLFGGQKLIAERKDLHYLSQYFEKAKGSGRLYEELHEIITRNYQPNKLHKFFAELPGRMDEKGYPLPYQMIVTTNYDDALERAFRKAKQPFDLVAYRASGEENRGKFIHKENAHKSEAKLRVIDKPNEDIEFPDDRPTILKLYGAVIEAKEENYFVITEDDYIDYLIQENTLPKSLLERLKNQQILFLGYDLSDWKHRLILRRIWEEKPLPQKYTPSTVRWNPGELERQLWEDRKVDIFERSLEDYITQLNNRIDVLPPRS